MHTYNYQMMPDEPTFRRASEVSANAAGIYWLGRFITLKMSDAELHQLRLAIDLADDVVNGPMK